MFGRISSYPGIYINSIFSWIKAVWFSRLKFKPYSNNNLFFKQFLVGITSFNVWTSHHSIDVLLGLWHPGSIHFSLSYILLWIFLPSVSCTVKSFWFFFSKISGTSYTLVDQWNRFMSTFISIIIWFSFQFWICQFI